MSGMFSLHGRIALVTGSSRGLGWAMAQALGRQGAYVVLNGRDTAILDSRVKELSAQGINGEAVAFDVSDFEASAAAIANVGKRLGRLDVFVGNAGIQHRRPITEFETVDFQRVIDTNLTGVFVTAREAARIMLPHKYGRIILIASLMSQIARPTVSAYVASKGAVSSLTRGLAVELAPHGITCNSIAPGFFPTEMNTPLVNNPEFSEWVAQRTPAGRWATMNELDAPVVFLASSAASYVTGHMLAVDGGFLAAA